MQVNFEDKTLTVNVSGRITSDNAPQWGEELDAVIKEHPEAAEWYVDATELSYISSAGLRELLNLQKQLPKKLHVVNVSDEVMEIFSTTGFSEIMDVRKVFKEITVDEREFIGKGRFGSVYRLDPERIVKVFHECKANTLQKIEGDRRLSQTLFFKGIPTAIPYDVVRVGDQYGLIFEMLTAQPLYDFMKKYPGEGEIAYRKTAQILKNLHQIDASELSIPSGEHMFTGWVKSLAALFSEEEKKQILDFLDRIPARNTVAHGDFHPGNVMVRYNEGDAEPEVILIDVGDIMSGHPLIDFFRLYPLSSIVKKALSGTEAAGIIQELECTKHKLDDAAYEQFNRDREQYLQCMIREYFGFTDDEDVKRADEALLSFALLRMFRVFFKKSMQDKPEVIEEIKHAFLERLHGIEGVLDLPW